MCSAATTCPDFDLDKLDIEVPATVLKFALGEGGEKCAAKPSNSGVVDLGNGWTVRKSGGSVVAEHVGESTGTGEPDVTIKWPDGFRVWVSDAEEWGEKIGEPQCQYTYDSITGEPLHAYNCKSDCTPIKELLRPASDYSNYLLTLELKGAPCSGVQGYGTARTETALEKAAKWSTWKAYGIGCWAARSLCEVVTGNPVGIFTGAASCGLQATFGFGLAQGGRWLEEMGNLDEHKYIGGLLRSPISGVAAVYGVPGVAYRIQSEYPITFLANRGLTRWFYIARAKSYLSEADFLVKAGNKFEKLSKVSLEAAKREAMTAVKILKETGILTENADKLIKEIEAAEDADVLADKIAEVKIELANAKKEPQRSAPCGFVGTIGGAVAASTYAGIMYQGDIITLDIENVAPVVSLVIDEMKIKMGTGVG